MSAISLPFALSTVPRYRCHKEVRAFKIGEVTRIQPVFKGPTCRGSIMLGSACGHCERCAWERSTGGRVQYRITPADDNVLSFHVDSAFIEKHKPEAGGYFVIYDDGYMSYSPAKAFEEGYTRIAS